ncbi:MAG: hypothetical protein IT378_22125, partial [Sandaracinaceae bacterium]|nr:hypothetical protein [Sandaracinaceae bacterium]
RPPPLARASRGEPRLLDIARPVIQPAIPLDELPPVIDVSSSEPPPPPRLSLEELLALAAENQAKLEAFDAEPPPPPPAPRPQAPPIVADDEALRERFGVTIDYPTLIAERARDAVTDLGMLGRMRRPMPEERWASGEVTEERMLTRVDALLACGSESWHDIVRLLDDRPLPDPELTFGIVFFLCSVAGDDTFDEAMRLVSLSDLADEEMRVMLADALVFAPHPRIDETLPRWLGDSSADRRALAAEVLRRRGTLLGPHLEQASRDSDPRVLASVAHALCAIERGRAAGTLGWLLAHEDERVARAALETSTRLRSPFGYERAVQLVQEDRGDFASASVIVAVSGDRDARRVLEDEVAGEGHPGVLRALGWYGDVGFVPFLLGRLRNGDEETMLAALDALERLTGASLTDADPEPTYSPEERPFVRERVDYEPGATLSMDADVWESWWRAHGRAADPKRRYRWGKPWALGDLVHELRHEQFPQRDRPYAALELGFRSHTQCTLDWTAWVQRQRKQVAEWTSRVSTSSSPPGSWPARER